MIPLCAFVGSGVSDPHLQAIAAEPQLMATQKDPPLIHGEQTSFIVFKLGYSTWSKRNMTDERASPTGFIPKFTSKNGTRRINKEDRPR
jgi:hypothetical protein